MRKFFFSVLVMCFIASPLSFAYFNPDSEEYAIEFEGATADDYETTLAITDPTADRTITFPDSSGTVAMEPLSYTTGMVFEGATADEFETTLAITDPTTPDKTITFPNATGTVSLLGVAETFSGVKTFSADPLITGTTPLLTIGDGGDEDTGIQFNSDTTDYYIASENALDDLMIGVGSAIGTTPAITINGSQDVDITTDLTVTGLDLTIGATGVKLTSDNDGALTFLGLSAGADENLTINLDDTADQIVLSSSTGANISTAMSITTTSSTNVAVLAIVPAASTAVASGATAGHIKIINDAVAATVCSADAAASSGGAVQVVCISNGTNWVAL